MSSGVYNALCGARTRLKMLDTVTHNMANLKTAGFKKGRTVFEESLSKALNHSQPVLREGFTDFSQGVLTPSGRTFDLAINGEGFFKVQDAEGNSFYTRQSYFNLDTEGYLVTADQLKLVDEGGQPVSASADAVIEEDGTIRGEAGALGTIPVYSVDDPTALKRHGGSYFALDGGQATMVESPSILQGHVEESNVNVMEEMARLVEAQRAFETSQKALKTYSKLGEQAVELGKVG